MAEASILTRGDVRPGDAAPVVREARRFQADGSISSVAFVGDTAFFVADGGTVLRVPPSEREEMIEAHDGAVLASTADGSCLITSGTDGRIVAFDQDGVPQTLAMLEKHKWLSALCSSAMGVAWSVGRDLFFRGSDGSERRHTTRFPVNAMAFSPDGHTLGLADREGVQLWRPEAGDPVAIPISTGPCVALRFNPDGRYLAASAYEPLVVVCDLAHQTSISLAGPTVQASSVSWSQGLDVLLTSGARQLMIWPILNRDGVLSSMPRLMAPYSELVAAVAYHPSRPIAAVGYADGMVLLVRLTDGAEIVLKSGRDKAISAIGWSNSGNRLAIGGEGGGARLFVVDFD